VPIASNGGSGTSGGSGAVAENGGLAGTNTPLIHRSIRGEILETLVCRMQYEYPDPKTGKTERLCWDDVSGNKVDCRIARLEKVPFPAGFANTNRRPDFKPIVGGYFK
jgi:hypothetical protein